MSTIASLVTTDAPWVHVLIAGDETLAAIKDGVRRLGSPKYAIIQLRGESMQDFDGLFDEMAGQLKFPAYSGRNFNALLDSLTDLSWLAAPGYLLCIHSGEYVLAAEASGDRRALFELLQRACDEWNHEVSVGEEWDRPAIPFHVVVQFGSGVPALPLFTGIQLDTLVLE